MWHQQDEQRERRLKDKIRRQAHHLGFQLVPIEPVSSASH
jgi:hypothetical protein